MANISFDGMEFSSLGFSTVDLNSRQMAAFIPVNIALPGRSVAADLSTSFDPGTSTYDATLSADTDNWSNYTKQNVLDRLDQIKLSLNPKKGFRKLVNTGDQPGRFRWARYLNMTLTEVYPVYKTPFFPVQIVFQNLEPYWRVSNAQQIISGYPASLANPGADDVKPRIKAVIAGEIAAFMGATLQPVSLFTIDDFQVLWNGTALGAGALETGDILTIDSDTLTATVQAGGVGTPVDVVRYYGYGGPGAYTSDGFPIIRQGGSTLANIHPNVNSLIFDYDTLYL